MKDGVTIMRECVSVETIDKEIEFITSMITDIIDNYELNSNNKLDIHQMADLHRYAQTRLYFMQTRNELMKNDQS